MTLVHHRRQALSRCPRTKQARCKKDWCWLRKWRTLSQWLHLTSSWVLEQKIKLYLKTLCSSADMFLNFTKPPSSQQAKIPARLSCLESLALPVTGKKLEKECMLISITMRLTKKKCFTPFSSISQAWLITRTIWKRRHNSSALLCLKRTLTKWLFEARNKTCSKSTKSLWLKQWLMWIQRTPDFCKKSTRTTSSVSLRNTSWRLCVLTEIRLETNNSMSCSSKTCMLVNWAQSKWWKKWTLTLSLTLVRKGSSSNLQSKR